MYSDDVRHAASSVCSATYTKNSSNWSSWEWKESCGRHVSCKISRYRRLVSLSLIVTQNTLRNMLQNEKDLCQKINCSSNSKALMNNRRFDSNNQIIQYQQITVMKRLIQIIEWNAVQWFIHVSQCAIMNIAT